MHTFPTKCIPLDSYLSKKKICHKDLRISNSIKKAFKISQQPTLSGSKLIYPYVKIYLCKKKIRRLKCLFSAIKLTRSTQQLILPNPRPIKPRVSWLINFLI